MDLSPIRVNSDSPAEASLRFNSAISCKLKKSFSQPVAKLNFNTATSGKLNGLYRNLTSNRWCDRLLIHQWQYNKKGAAFAFNAVKTNAAVHFFHQRFANTEAKAGAAALAGV